MSRRVAGLAIFSIVMVAAGLRCYELNARSIWFDEAFSWTLTSQFSLTEVMARTANDVHPPFYYLVLWVWIRVFGQTLVAMRLLSVVFGTSAVFVSFLVGRAAMRGSSPLERAEPDASDNEPANHGTWLGISFAILMATSPFQIHWSGEVRMYSLLTLLFLLCVLFGLRALHSRQGRGKWWAGFSLTSAAMMYTHNYGLFSFVSLAFFFLSATLYQDWKTAGSSAKLSARECLMSLGLACLLYLPWVPTLLHQRSQVVANYWIAPFSLRQLAAAWDGVLFPENSYGPWQDQRGRIALIVTVLLLVGLQIRGKVVDRLGFVLTAVPILLAIIISATSTSIIAYRLFVLAHVSSLLAVARGTQKWLEPVAGLLMTLVFAADCLWLHRNYVAQLQLDSHPGARGAVAWVEANATNVDPILVLHPCIYFSLRYHATTFDRITLCTTSQNVVHYTGGPILKQNERLDFSAIQDIDADRIWVIDTSGFSAGYSRPLISLPWQWKREQKFPAPYAFEGEIIVSEYVRVKPSNGSDIK